MLSRLFLFAIGIGDLKCPPTAPPNKVEWKHTWRAVEDSLSGGHGDKFNDKNVTRENSNRTDNSNARDVMLVSSNSQPATILLSGRFLTPASWSWLKIMHLEKASTGLSMAEEASTYRPGRA